MFAAQVRERGLKAGVMVEVPSTALLAHRFLEVVDFLSIGTNDLTQYAMAADRMASDLAHLTDPWQPAVLALVAITAEAGKQAGKPVGVCGEAAADPMLATALVGMGVTSLSMASAAVRAVGAQLADVRWTSASRRPRRHWRRAARPPGATPYVRCSAERVPGGHLDGNAGEHGVPAGVEDLRIGQVVDAGTWEGGRTAQPDAVAAVPVAVRQADHAGHHRVGRGDLDLDGADA